MENIRYDVIMSNEKARRFICNARVPMREQQDLEWKREWKDEYLAEICGFANAQGGRLLVGVDNSGKIVGVSNARKLLEDLPNKISAQLGIVADVDCREESGLDIIEIRAFPSPTPITYKGVCYRRSGSTNQTLNGAALSSFWNERIGATWDAFPCPDFTLDDVDEYVVKRFKKRASQTARLPVSIFDESKEIFLKRLRLIKNGKLVNAAPLLFAEEPEEWIIGAYTKIGFFRTNADIEYQDEIHGSLLEQVDKIVDTIRVKYMKAKITYEGLRRIERYFVPNVALREAVLNALCHMDYSKGIPVQISVYEDKLYVANNGSLPFGWTADSLLQKHESKPRNPLLARAFYYGGFIESWGRGIENIFEDCRKAEVPKPTYYVNPSDIMLKFTAPYDWPFVSKNRESE